MLYYISNPYAFQPFSCWISYAVTSFGYEKRPDVKILTVNLPLNIGLGGTGIKLPDVRAAP